MLHLGSIAEIDGEPLSVSTVRAITRCLNCGATLGELAEFIGRPVEDLEKALEREQT